MNRVSALADQNFTTAVQANRTRPDSDAWNQVASRDPTARFFYGVKTTGIFCRPNCPSRRPAKRNAVFFKSVDQALASGFRPCLRCQPVGPPAEAATVATICAHLKVNSSRKVPLAELARIAKASPFTVQRLVRRVLGVSPLEYQRELRAAALREGLAVSAGPALAKPGKARRTKVLSGRGTAGSVTDAIYDAGYASSSAVYGDTRLGMSPGTYRRQGAGETIRFATANCPLGIVLVAATMRGICAVFLGEDAATLEAELRGRFPAAEIAPDPEIPTAGNAGATQRGTLLAIPLDQVISQMSTHPASLDLPLDVQATAFQTRVWHALQAIPRGETRSYAEVARELGRPTAVRAVARACASNPVALLIPCHRVVGSNGKLTGYHWGVDRKRRLLALEQAKPPS